jgi:hypothetical protein
VSENRASWFRVLFVLYCLVFIYQIDTGVQAIGMELQLGFTPGSMRLSKTHKEKRQLNREDIDGSFSEAQEDMHSSMSGSLEEHAKLKSDEEDTRQPVTVGVVVWNVAHLSRETLILRVTLNEFHRWNLELEPCDDEKSDGVQDQGGEELMNGAESTDERGPGDQAHVAPYLNSLTAIRIGLIAEANF